MIGKNIFYITLSGAIIFCCIFTCMLVKSCIDKRNSLTQYYSEQFRLVNLTMFNKNATDRARTIALNDAEKIEKNMLEDGYDRAETLDAIKIGFHEALSELAETEKEQQEIIDSTTKHFAALSALK